jgi:hypothetical protein
MMKKLHVGPIACAIALFACTGISYGAWGFYDAQRSYIGFNSSNGSLNYSVWNSGVGSFQGNNLGTYSSGGNLTLSYYDVKTYKNSGSDVTGGTFYWRVYKVGDTPGSYNSLGLGFQSDLGGGNQQWGFSGNTSNILSGLSFNTGLNNYKLEIYGAMNGTNPNETQYDNNGGANYIANLSTIPEPSTFALLAIGALGAGFLARRRKS